MDCAPGFTALAKAEDKQLAELGITIVTRDEFNRNNAVVDQACRELEGELCKLAPEGGKISQAQLSSASLAQLQDLEAWQALSIRDTHCSRALFR